MAKRAIILTLLEKNNRIKSFGLNPKAFSESNEYINVLKRSLDKKGVIITNFFFVNDANTFKLKLQVFFKAQKIKRYRKKSKKHKKLRLKLKRRIFRRFKWRFFWKLKRIEIKERALTKNSVAPWKRKYVKRNKLIRNRRNNRYFLNRVKLKRLKLAEKTLKKSQKVTQFETKKNQIQFNSKKNNPMPFKSGKNNPIPFKSGKNSPIDSGKKVWMQMKKMAKKRLLKSRAKLSIKKSKKLDFKKEKKLKKIEKRTETFKSITKFLPVKNLLVHEFEVLNKQVVTKIAVVVDENFKDFKRMLFSRRATLYIDFLKMTALFAAKKINIATYNTILGTIFKFLLKKSHSKFFAFLRKLFTFLVKVKIIAGIKISINGKLKGKLRAKPYNIIVGRIGAYGEHLDMDFSKIHIHTLYGCFGFKTLVKFKHSKKIYAIRSKKVKV